MKKTVLSALSVLFVVCNASAVLLKSPDGSITVETGSPASLSVRHCGTDVFDIDGMGIVVDGSRLVPDFAKPSPPAPIDEAYTMLSGKRKLCHNQANEYVFPMGAEAEMQIRVYNDGVALRYLLRQPHAVLSDDLTSFSLSHALGCWLQKYTSCYEDFFSRYDKGCLAQGEWGYPALVEASDGCFALLSEADVHRANSASRLASLLSPESLKVSLPDTSLAVSGPWVSPWRVAIVGSLDRVVESTLITDLSEPCLLAETDWIRPGVVSWIYWAHNHGSNDYQIVRNYIDLARTLRLPYVLIDAEWDDMANGGDIRDAVAYALSQGVKPLIWYNSSTSWFKEDGAPGPHFRLNDPAAREAEFSAIADWGVAGVKIDFFDGDFQRTMHYCIDLLECAARHRLLVNFHGATVPRGWQRTYPNLMSVEAVYGAEWYNNKPVLTDRAARHNATLPFTRNVIGSMDYTPCAFSDSQHPHITTKGHELALTVVFESALQHIADRPESLLAQPLPVQDFFGHLPAAWDDTRFLGGYPGDWVAIARRSGSSWYVGILNGTDTEKTVQPDWSKIVDTAVPIPHTLYADHPSLPDQWHILSSCAPLPPAVTLSPRSGLLLHIPLP